MLEREIPPLTRRVSVLLELGVPDHLDDALLPSHIRMDDDGQSIILWGSAYWMFGERQGVNCGR